MLRATFAPMALFEFPNPVDEVSARLVAGAVVLIAALTIVLDWKWGTIVLAVGFFLRVLSGPRFSPLGLLVTKVVRPRLAIEPRYCPGPPKRFAQAIGFVFSTVAAVLWIGVGSAGAGKAVLAALVVAASLESFAGFCLGCWMFGLLMRVGLIPEPICERCASVGSGSPSA